MQLHERDLTLIEADLVLAHSHCHSAVIVPGEHADIDLAAVHRLVEPDLDLAAHELFKVPRALQLTLCPGRADLENIAVGNGVGLVQNRVEPAADALTVIDADAAVLIDKDAQEPASGLTDIFNVPKAEPSSSTTGFASSVTLSVILLIFRSLSICPAEALPVQKFRKKEWAGTHSD